MNFAARLVPVAIGALVAALALAVLTVVVNAAIGTVPDARAIPEFVAIVAVVVAGIAATQFWLGKATAIGHAPEVTRIAPTCPTSRARARPSTPTPTKSIVVSAAVMRQHALPPLSLLAAVARQSDEEHLSCAAQAAQIIEALASFDIDAKVVSSHHGPVVRTHHTTLARGTRLSKVVAMTDDVSLALGRKVRIAPSGMGQVAFEVARESRVTVALRDLLEAEDVSTSNAVLPVILGACAQGEALVVDLAELPHLLLAGATGTGKSVGLNAVLASLLFTCTPAELRLILIDPKQVELAPYDGIPHLVTPVVRDMRLAGKTLAALATEMDRRYALLASARCRGLASFNARSAKPLPRIVVVIDELADLLASERKSLEPLLLRLAQKGRASGIHIIAATQRPSVDVVSGVLKANIPARVSYRVASAVDSRVVLDEAGAEQLIGRGDALVRLPGADRIRRVQTPWVSEADVDALCDHLRRGA